MHETEEKGPNRQRMEIDELVERVILTLKN